MRKIALFTMALTTATAPQAAHAGGLLDKLGKLVTQADKTLNSTMAPMATVKPTAEQVAATQSLIANQPATPELKADLIEAAPLIEKLVQTSACGINDTAWNSLNRYHQRPTSWSTYTGSVARHGDQYHDDATCDDVVRLTDVSKPAANALQFTAYYISPSSQNGSHQKFTLVKSSAGEWMIRNIGLTFS